MIGLCHYCFSSNKPLNFKRGKIFCNDCFTNGLLVSDTNT